MSTAVVKKPKSSLAGRHMFDGRQENEVLTKLEFAFSRGCNILESCCYAGISHMSLYRFFDKKPEYRDRIKALQSRPEMHSKLNIVAKIEKGNITNSKWWLEHKQGSGFNKSDYDTSSVPEGQDMDNQGIARIIAICVGRSIAEYETARQSRAGKTAKDL